MRAIILTAWHERGRNVYTDKKVEEMKKHFYLTNRIYKKEDIVSPENDFSDVEAVFACWGIEDFTEEEVKEHLPNLKALFYVGGSFK